MRGIFAFLDFSDKGIEAVILAISFEYISYVIGVFGGHAVRPVIVWEFVVILSIVLDRLAG